MVTSLRPQRALYCVDCKNTTTSYSGVVGGDRCAHALLTCRLSHAATCQPQPSLPHAGTCLPAWTRHSSPATPGCSLQRCRLANAAALSPPVASRFTFAPWSITATAELIHDIVIIIIIYLLKSTEQEDAHMINTRTRAGQERHRKLALTFCP